jgi:hypothetical protein
MAQFAAHVKSIFFGQHDVEQDQVEVVPSPPLHCRLSVTRHFD